MKKQIIVSGMIIILIVGLSGCVVSNDGSNSGDKEKFVGTWVYGDGLNDVVFDFFSDGTGFLESGVMTWDIKDDKLVVNWLGDLALSYDYGFSENNTKLTLTSKSEGTKTYIKQ